MDAQQITDRMTRYRNGLLDEVLPFWLKHGIDHDHGGVITSLDRDGSVIDTDIGVWQQGRFAWLLGELYNHRLLQDHPQRTLWENRRHCKISGFSK